MIGRVKTAGATICGKCCSYGNPLQSQRVPTAPWKPSAPTLSTDTTAELLTNHQPGGGSLLLDRGGLILRYRSDIGLDSTADFTFRWPNMEERFTDAQEGVVQHDGRNYHVKVGFTTRRSAGTLRRRSLVLLDRFPTVEFVASNTTPKNGKMARKTAEIMSPQQLGSVRKWRIFQHWS